VPEKVAGTVKQRDLAQEEQVHSNTDTQTNTHTLRHLGPLTLLAMSQLFTRIVVNGLT